MREFCRPICEGDLGIHTINLEWKICRKIGLIGVGTDCRRRRMFLNEEKFFINQHQGGLFVDINSIIA